MRAFEFERKPDTLESSKVRAFDFDERPTADPVPYQERAPVGVKHKP